jgi:hypothetical protein
MAHVLMLPALLMPSLWVQWRVFQYGMSSKWHILVLPCQIWSWESLTVFQILPNINKMRYDCQGWHMYWCCQPFSCFHYGSNEGYSNMVWALCATSCSCHSKFGAVWESDSPSHLWLPRYTCVLVISSVSNQMPLLTLVKSSWEYHTLNLTVHTLVRYSQHNTLPTGALYTGDCIWTWV